METREVSKLANKLDERLCFVRGVSYYCSQGSLAAFRSRSNWKDVLGAWDGQEA